MAVARTQAVERVPVGAPSRRPPSRLHLPFLGGEALLLTILAVLTIAVKMQAGPLPGDARIEVDWQHWLRPHHWITGALNGVSTINWPIPAAITVAAACALLLVLRRWLDTAVVLLVVVLADGTDYAFSQWVHRARPSGHGIYMAKHITSSYSFPSGHVLQATAFFGFLLFLTFQVRRQAAAWLWPLRAVLVFLILAMGPSRVLEGEHWPSDVLAGLAYGGFWLLLGIHLYSWARGRWPGRLLSRGSHRSGGAPA